jgi:hypothetical protein
MKLGISSEDLQDLIVTRLSFYEEYEQQSIKAWVMQIQNWG